MEKICLLTTLLLASIACFGRVVCDTTCHAPEDEFRNFAVVSPVGRSMVSHVEQAPRLTTLDNGIAVLRTAEYPGAFATHTNEQLIENTRNVTWPQIVAGLTTPVVRKTTATT